MVWSTAAWWGRSSGGPVVMWVHRCAGMTTGRPSGSCTVGGGGAGDRGRQGGSSPGGVPLRLPYTASGSGFSGQDPRVPGGGSPSAKGPGSPGSTHTTWMGRAAPMRTQVVPGGPVPARVRTFAAGGRAPALGGLAEVLEHHQGDDGGGLVEGAEPGAGERGTAVSHGETRWFRRGRAPACRAARTPRTRPMVSLAGADGRLGSDAGPMVPLAVKEPWGGWQSITNGVEGGW